MVSASIKGLAGNGDAFSGYRSAVTLSRCNEAVLDDLRMRGFSQDRTFY
jgi:hypothetical protein